MDSPRSITHVDVCKDQTQEHGESEEQQRLCRQIHSEWKSHRPFFTRTSFLQQQQLSLSLSVSLSLSLSLFNVYLYVNN